MQKIVLVIIAMVVNHITASEAPDLSEADAIQGSMPHYVNLEVVSPGGGNNCYPVSMQEPLDFQCHPPGH